MSGQECEHDHDHDHDHSHTTGTEQTLEELEFSRSACAAAQLGDMAKLVRALDRHPEHVHSVGEALFVPFVCICEL